MYLIAIIDDATRMVVQAGFYDNQKLPVLEDAFRKAVLRCGSPDNLYVDYVARNIIDIMFPFWLCGPVFKFMAHTNDFGLKVAT